MTKPNPKSPKPPLPAALRERIDRIHMQMFDVIERVLAQLASANEERAPSLMAARRQAANILGLWRFCGRSTCQRRRCCRGEPRECLQAAMPLLPAETLASLVAADKRRGARRPIL